MLKSEICVVIPVYKERLLSYEIQSVNQCVKVLSGYKIFFVCPEGIDIDFYKANFPEIVNYFFLNKVYFKDLEGYNKLMLNLNFYKFFNEFNYMLVYQTDCYVFRDELLDWCNKGYDYIGGVWFEGFVVNPNQGAKIWQAGNGGFSLRKIESVIKILSSKKPLKTISELLQEKKRLLNVSRFIFVKELLLLPLNFFGYQNNYSYFAKNYKLNEDFFYIEISNKSIVFKIPKIEDALLFSWDRCPSFMYQKLRKLPFGCHAWFREEFPYEQNKKFWLKKIKQK